MAHIRHTYTDYDQLLRVGSWEQARSAVEHMTLDKLVAWRADKDDNADVMADILREVIVIDDDDDEDGPNIDGIGVKSQKSQHHRDSSVEIVSSQAGAETLQTQQIDYHDLEEAEPQEPINSAHLKPYIYGQQPQLVRQRLERSDAHRRRAWEDARSRYRQGPPSTTNPFTSRDYLEPRRSPGPQAQPSPILSANKRPWPTQAVDLTHDRSAQQADIRSKVKITHYSRLSAMLLRKQPMLEADNG